MDNDAEKPWWRRPISRRSLLIGSGVALLSGTGAYGYATMIEPHWLAINRQTMTVRNLPNVLDGKTILQMTDFHAGPVVSRPFLQETIGRGMSLKPDMVVLTGDLTDQRGDRFQDEIVEDLLPTLDAPLGVYTVLGNHDYGYRWREVKVAERLASLLANNGFKVLRNEIAEVQGLQIVGVEDYWCPLFNVNPVIDVWDNTRPAIALCHNPDVCDLDAWQDFEGWVLSGHTHGGQCKPPFLPPPLLPVENRRYTRGRFDLSEKRTLFISCGIGYNIRARFNVRPEVVLFTLRRI